MSHGFDLTRHVREYHYDFATMVNDVMASTLCNALRERIEGLISTGIIKLVDHHGQGTAAVSDSGFRNSGRCITPYCLSWPQ